MAIKIKFELTKEQLEQLKAMESKIAFQMDEYILSKAAEIKAEMHMTEIGGIPASARAYLLYHNLLRIEREAED